MTRCISCGEEVSVWARRCGACVREMEMPKHRPEHAERIEAALKRAATLRRYHDRLRGGSALSGNGWEQRADAAGGAISFTRDR